MLFVTESVETGAFSVGRRRRRSRSDHFVSEETSPYSATLLSAIEDWMNHDPARRMEKADRLREKLKHVEPEFKTCEVRCYRRIDFPRDSADNPRGIPLPLLDLLHTGRLKESVSSWTTDPAVARAHLEGVQTDATCVIFARIPQPHEVWVDLSRLLRSPRFKAALGSSGYPAIRQWMARESEVILEIPHVTPHDVFAWGGFAGTLEQLKNSARADGKSPEEIENLEELLKSQGARPGQEWWLSEERSVELAVRMQAFARSRYVYPPPE